jgi:NADH:ubiquinone oxidoreductase subunit H
MQLIYSFSSIIILIGVLITVAFYTLGERKIMAAIQRRKGPNVVGFCGILQPVADGLKLILKETTIPLKANKMIFTLGPIISFVLAFTL